MDETGRGESTEELQQETKQELYKNLSSSISVLSENLFDHATVSRFSKREVDPEEVGTHQLTIAVTISLAVSSVVEKDNPARNAKEESSASDRTSKKVLESPKAQKFFRCEYELLPGDEAVVRTDLVIYGSVAKIYVELQEPKAVRTWTNGAETWITWTNCHTVTVTESLLKSLISHQTVLRIWEGKDKVTTKARFDRPKGFRLLKSDDFDKSCVRSTILKQFENYQSFRPGRLERSPVGKVSDHMVQSKNTAATEMQFQNNSPKGTKPQKARTDLQDQKSKANSNLLSQEAGKQRSNETEVKTKSRPNFEKGSAAGLSSKEESVKLRQRKNEIDQNGLCSISLPFARLYAGTLTVTERMPASVEPVHDAFVTLALDKPLLSAEQAKKLNPLVIEVRSATDLPSTPVSFGELRQRCKPAYVKYKMFDDVERVSKGLPQDQSLYWDDINIILAGLMDTSLLREYLSGPRLEIEVHDRDRVIKVHEEKGSVFGEGIDDQKISNIGTVTSRRTIQDAFRKYEKSWNPYGVASFDLSGLLLGQTILYLEAPIRNCPAPDVLGLENQKKGLVGLVGSVDGPADASMKSGDFLWSDASLKIKVQLAHSLTTPRQLASQVILDLDRCPFARAVFKFDQTNTSLLHKLHSCVFETNVKALGLIDLPKHVQSMALATYRLSAEQIQDQTLNIITGFKLIDGEIQLYVLEGLRHGALKELTMQKNRLIQPGVQVLYHSNLGFQNRLYASLGPDLLCIKLHEPLSVIMKQPRLYVRDLVPSSAFQGLYKIHLLCQVNTLRGAVKNDLFPSADMVVSMSREFAVPVEASDFHEIKLELEAKHEEGSDVAEEEILTAPSQVEVKESRQQVQSEEEENMEDLHVRKEKSKNWLRRNKDFVNELSEKSKLQHRQSLPAMISADVDIAYNCGNQKLNSAELAKNKLREILAVEKDAIFSYCPEYHHSMTFQPVDLNQLSKDRALKARQKWLTTLGWTPPNKRSTVQKRAHPKKLHPANVDELQIPAEELYNWADASFISREPFPWDERKLDMDIWTTLSKFQAAVPHLPSTFGSENSCIGLEEEKKLVEQRKVEEWKSKVVVDDIRQHFHRCAIETELQEFGLKSSNQVARLQGLLKGCPQKLSLRKPPLGLTEIPALAVVNYPSVDTACQKEIKVIPSKCPGEDEKCFNPGSYTSLRLSHPNNSIPAVNYNHKFFEDVKGKDFNVFFRERGKVYTRRILPLEEVEGDRGRFHCSMWRERLDAMERIRQWNNMVTRSLVEKPQSL